MPTNSIAVVLPAFNEEQTIADTIAGFCQALPMATVYVINNNSEDRTRELALAALQAHGNPGTVIDEPLQGKGNALRRAFHDIDADVYLLADADLTYPANRAADLIAPVLQGQAEIVVGDRLSGGHYARENQRPFHNLGNRIVQLLVNHLFNARLSDIMSGYRAMSRRFVKTYPILVEGFQIETDMTLHALYRRFRILEMPVEYKDRPTGSYSKLNTLADGARVLFAITQILRYYRPLLFFSVFALSFAALGLFASAPVLYDWVTMRYITHVPLAILSSAMEIVALLLLAVGLMLDSVAHHERLAFEVNLMRRWPDSP